MEPDAKPEIEWKGASNWPVTEEAYLDGYRALILYDEMQEYADPRKNDNIATLVMRHPHYELGDHKPEGQELEALERGGWPLLRRYLKLVVKAVALTRIGMYDHSGITIYPVGWDEKPDHVFDPGGWDSSLVGYGYISGKAWEENFGADDPKSPVEGERNLGLGRLPVMEEHAYQVLRSEISEYDDYLRGEVYAYSVQKRETWHKDSDPDEEREDWETVDSCGGFVGDVKYVREEAESALRYAVKTGEPLSVTAARHSMALTLFHVKHPRSIGSRASTS